MPQDLNDFHGVNMNRTTQLAGPHLFLALTALVGTGLMVLLAVNIV